VTEWDERYSRGEHATSQPSDLLVKAAGNLKPGRALDLACGAGRHALYLAEHGWHVTAVDSSRVAIGILKNRANERGLIVDARIADLELEEFEIEPDAYDLVCVFYYLQRDIFPAIRDGIKEGGACIAAIHMVDESPNVKPMNPNFLLHSGELQEYFRDWEIVHYHETDARDTDPGKHTRRSAEIITRKR
jgi:SAM-dependent methyltransferase